jgi:hypothetical protein
MESDNESVFSEEEEGYGTEEEDNKINERTTFKEIYLGLLEDLRIIILQYNFDVIDTDTFYLQLNTNTNKLNNNQDVLLNYIEIEYRSLLSDLSNDLVRGKKLSEVNIVQINRLRSILYPVEPETPDVAWNVITDEQRQEIKAMAMKNKIKYPARDQFDSNEKYEKACDDFYDRFALFLPDYFSQFIEKEEKEILSLAKKRKIKKPKDPNELAQFYKDMVQLLPGYVHRMTPTSIGYTYEKVEENDIKEIIKEDAKETISPLEQESYNQYIFSKQKYVPLLLTFDKKYLIDFIMKKVNKDVQRTTVVLPERRKVDVQFKEPVPEITAKEGTRSIAKKELKKFLPEQKVKYLEQYIYHNYPNIINYKEKVKDILFLFKNYEDIRVNNLYQLVLFEKNVINLKVKTTHRRNAIKYIYKILNYKNQNQTKYPIIKKAIIGAKAEKIENMIYNLAKNEKEYNSFVNALENYDPMFANEATLAMYLIKKEDHPVNDVNYRSMNLDLKEIDVFISLETKNLKELYRKRTTINSSWKPDKKIVTEYEYQNFFKLKGSYLDEFKQLLQKKYRLEVSPELALVNKLIDKKEKDIVYLEDTRNILLNKTVKKWENVYVETLQEKYNKTFTEDMVNEIIQAHKRKLLANASLKPYDIIYYLELYDFNELNNNTKINGKPIIEKEMYEKIKVYTLKELQKYLSGDPSVLLKKYQFESISYFAKLLHTNIDITTPQKAIKDLTPYWKDLETTDFYGKQIHEVDPFDSYNSVYREYNNLVKKYTKKPETIYRKPRALFNEVTGKFSDPNGTMYDVMFLDKDMGTHQPLKQYTDIAEKNPRTNKIEYVKKETYVKGKYPFILRKLPTTTSKKLIEVMTEVPISAVRYYPNDYDSCSRFKHEPECINGSGAYYKPCVFKDNKCTVSSFGRKRMMNVRLKPNKLSDPVSKRRR